MAHRAHSDMIMAYQAPIPLLGKFHSSFVLHKEGHVMHVEYMKIVLVIQIVHPSIQLVLHVVLLTQDPPGASPLLQKLLWIKESSA